MKYLTMLLVMAVSALAAVAAPPSKATTAVAADTPAPSYTYAAVVDHVKDGDTVSVNVDLGFSIWKHGEALRLVGVFAPETFRPKTAAEKTAGLKVKSYLVDRLPSGTKVVIQTERDGTDKYGRMLAQIWDAKGNVNTGINDFMRENGIKPGGAGISGS